MYVLPQWIASKNFKTDSLKEKCYDQYLMDHGGRMQSAQTRDYEPKFS